MKVKIFKKISKKVTALLLSLAILFSNLMPLSTVFALTNEEKANLVEMKMRDASGIDIDNGEATIHYNGGYVTVSGADLHHEENNNWNFGDHYGVMHILYTSSTSLTFHFYPEENFGVSYRVDGNNPERPENNVWTVNNLETVSQRPAGYDVEFGFIDENGGGGAHFDVPQSSEINYRVQFGNGSPYATWNVNNVNVTASIQGKDLTNGFLYVNEAEAITLNNFDVNTMEVLISGDNNFQTRLHVNENSITYFAWVQGGGVLPQEGYLYFNVVEKQVENNGNYQVDFGDAEWDIDEEHVTASIEGLEVPLNNGPVELEPDTAIHLEGFNPQTMEVNIVVPDGNGHDFSTRLNVDNNSNTSLDAVDPEVHVPNGGVVIFNVQRIGGGEEQVNPPQEGNKTAIVRVNGYGDPPDHEYYTEIVTDPETGEEREERIYYDGPGDSPANHAKFSINHGAIWSLLPEGETYEDSPQHWYLYNEIEYPYNGEDEDDTVTIGMFTEWHLKYSYKVKINNVEYPISIDYENRNNWISHVDPDQSEYVGFYIEGVDKADDDIYEITVQIDRNDTRYVSEFRWSNDPWFEYVHDGEGNVLYDEHNDPLINPEYVGHAKIEVVGAQFEVGGQTYTYNANDFSRPFSDDYIDYGFDNHDQYTDGYLIVPSDTTVTIRVIPDPGYQLYDIIVPSNVEAGEDPYTYTFTLPTHREELEFILGEEDNIVNKENDYFEEVGIAIPNVIVINGNYQMDVTEAELTNEQTTAFETYAGNYNINKYFNIGLNQVITKANVENNAQWIIPLNNLNEDAAVALTLNNAINADSIVIIRSNGDGTFTTITPTVNGKTLTFETRKFGDFAIASLNLTVIDAIDITVTPPTPGVKVDVTMQHDPESNEDYPVGNPAPEVTVDANAPYVIDGSAWVNGTCHGGANLCNEYFNGTFDVNGEYYAIIYLSAKAGNKLTYDTLDHITVNGRALDTGNGDELFNIYDNGNNTMFIVKIAPEQTTPVMKGDMNGNGKIDLADVILLLRRYLNDDATPEEILTGDIDNSGSIGLSDIIGLLRMYLES